MARYDNNAIILYFGQVFSYVSYFNSFRLFVEKLPQHPSYSTVDLSKKKEYKKVKFKTVYPEYYRITYSRF